MAIALSLLGFAWFVWAVRSNKRKLRDQELTKRADQQLRWYNEDDDRWLYGPGDL